MFAGWDEHHGFQLYHSDPSGNYGGWKATAIGSNNQAAKSFLKGEYADEMTVPGALELAVKVSGVGAVSAVGLALAAVRSPPSWCIRPLQTLAKTMDVTPTVESVEFATVTRCVG